MKDSELEELKSATGWTPTKSYTGILYGEFGVRKTTTALRCMTNRAIILYADPGWHVVHNHPEEFDEDNVIPIKYESLTQVRRIIEAVETNAEGYEGVDLIVVDTLSQIQENYIDFLLENAQYSGNFREKATAKAGRKLEGESSVEIPGMPDYHLARNKIRPVITALVACSADVIFLAHTREPSPIEKGQGKIERRPNITEALYKVVSRNATFIGYMEKGKEGYTVNFEPSKTLSAKAQIPTLTDKKILSEELPKHIHDWK